MDSPTSVKLTGQCPPGIVGSQRNDTGLHCRNNSAVVIVLKIVVLMMILHSIALCHQRTIIRSRNSATDALDAAMPI